MSTNDDFSRDIDRVNHIPIVSTLLDIICQTTGMGFSAVARVTQDRWIACQVRDDIQFGLVPGSELVVNTTICDEIRDSHQPVIIDSVETDTRYCNHHTPARYGFKSYISFPIILKNGKFFGTLCAIGNQPAQLNNPKTIGIFSAFTDLIAFHMQQLELMEVNQATLNTLGHQLTSSIDENRQYHFISNHNLQEPLRKISLFSGMLIDILDGKDIEEATSIARKIASSAQRISQMIKGLTNFSALNDQNGVFEVTDLNKLIDRACADLSSQIEISGAIVNTDRLPSLSVIPWQLEQLFYQLLHNAIKFSRKGIPPLITIKVSDSPRTITGSPTLSGNESGFVDILVSDNGIGIEESQLDKIFNIFSHVPLDQIREGQGIGLAYCRKVMANHSGMITAHSEAGRGTVFSIRLPISSR